MDEIIIKRPMSDEDFERYFQLRWEILRKPWNEPQGSEQDDIENSCCHRMAVLGGQVVGVARLQLNSAEQAQIRYMGVDAEVRGRGIGRKLVEALEFEAREKGVNCIRLHARENAMAFYVILGYRVIEESYLLFDEIQHFLMHKDLF